MISITNISKTFNTNKSQFHALKNVSLNIEEGFIHGIIGPSGAGKSTLIRTINQLETYDTGSINVFEYKDIKKLNKESTRMLRQKMGMVFQNFNLLSRQTVFDNIAFPIKLERKITREDKKKIYEIIELVGLKGYEESYPNQLSGGQKQRVGIARALINNPRILLCDEPTSALDTGTIRNILYLLKDLKERLNLTIVIVTHDMNVVKEICDYVTVMDRGQIVENNTTENIIFNPEHEVTKVLLGTVGFNIDYLIDKFKGHPNLCLLKFNKLAKREAIISQISLELEIPINILYANITAKDKGIMLVSIPSIENDLHKKLNSVITDRGVEVRYV